MKDYSTISIDYSSFKDSKSEHGGVLYALNCLTTSVIKNSIFDSNIVSG